MSAKGQKQTCAAHKVTSCFGPKADVVAMRVSALLDHRTDNGAQVSSVKLNVVPGPLLRAAHTRPPCASIMDRQIDSPIPIPLGLVVRNGLNSLSAISGSMPLPRSCTATTT